MTDWVDWHKEYDDPTSRLSKRVANVRKQLVRAIDRAPKGEVRIISACAGRGLDVIPVVATHPRRDDVRALLVELDPELSDSARASASPNVDVITGDASTTSAYAAYVPAHIALLCGIFGNITDEDIKHTIGVLRSLLMPGGEVIWTRGAFSDVDLRPVVRRWFIEAGFEELAYDAEDKFGVGTHRLTTTPAPFEAGVTMFQFFR